MKNVTLKELLPKLKEIAWAGSVIQVSIFSDYSLSTGTLKSLLDGIEANQHMELIYIVQQLLTLSTKHTRITTMHTLTANVDHGRDRLSLCM